MTAVSLPVSVDLLEAPASPTDGQEQVDVESLRETSVSVDQPRLEAMEALIAVASEASEEGWDGYEGKRVLGSTLSKAFSFLATLPSTVPGPDISAHPDGEVAFYWSPSPRRTLSVSVNAAGRVSFAAIVGHQRLFGSEYLTDELPESIALALRQLYSSAP
jgi:hypothetical protein